MQQRLPSLLEHPIAFAHRGGKAHAPENTIEAFTLGLKLGATGIESDVWLTSDGIPVLDHDGSVRHRFSKRPIGELRRAQLPSFIPTLAELFEACGTNFHLSLDLKGPDVGLRVLDVVHEAAADLLPRLWLCEPNWQSLLPLRSRLDGAKLVDSTRNGGLVTLFHRFEVCCIAWDLQFEHVLRPMFRMGIDGVHSDWVDRMMDAYRAELGAPRL
jgi:glycerophosphoryl diester phosphodiesterase